MNVGNVLALVKGKAVEKSPELLIGMGIAGLLRTTYLAVKATPEALELIDDKKDEINSKAYSEARDKGYDMIPCETLTIPQTVEATWKCYLPSAITAVASVGCIIAGSSIFAKRNAAMAAAYALTEQAFANYKTAVNKSVSETKKKTINDNLAEIQTTQNKPQESNIVETSKPGELLWYDEFDGSYFYSNKDIIKAAVNNINAQLNSEGYASLNDFRYQTGRKGTRHGELVGWNRDRGLISFSYGSTIVDDKTLAFTLVFDQDPYPKYDRIYQ